MDVHALPRARSPGASAETRTLRRRGTPPSSPPIWCARAPLEVDLGGCASLLIGAHGQGIGVAIAMATMLGVVTCDAPRRRHRLARHGGGVLGTPGSKSPWRRTATAARVTAARIWREGRGARQAPRRRRRARGAQRAVCVGGAKSPRGMGCLLLPRRRRRRGRRRRPPGAGSARDVSDAAVRRARGVGAASLRARPNGCQSRHPPRSRRVDFEDGRSRCSSSWTSPDGERSTAGVFDASPCSDGALPSRTLSPPLRGAGAGAGSDAGRLRRPSDGPLAQCGST